jgi:carbamoylphosphate synthase large subunit
VRVLLTDGSGLTSRQAAGRLHELGHSVGVLSSSRLAITRWTNAVHVWHAVPPFASDPQLWWQAARRVLASQRYDVLLPTQEQVLAVARAEAAGDLPAPVATAVPSFEALCRVQDKLSAARTLADLGLPQPPYAVLESGAAASAWTRFPCYLKLPIGTASRGVRRVEDRAELVTAIDDPDLAASLSDGPGLLVQEAVGGPLAMVQAVADHGRLVAFHTNLRVAEGPGGGASHKRSVRLPDVERHIETLVGALDWHGAISADVVVAHEGGARFIDINPRLVEPGNAVRSGVDLVAAMLRVALGEHIERLDVGAEGVRTHQLLLAVLKAAEGPGPRRRAWTEVVDASRHRGRLRDSVEELTPPSHDPLSVVPVVAALGLTMLRPTLAGALVRSSTTAYATTADAWAALRA